MARGDFKIKSPIDEVFSVRRIVAAGSAQSIKAGEPTKEGTSGAVAIMADGDGTDQQRFSGMGKSDSTDTAAAAGIVYTWLPLAGLIYEGRPKVAGSANTQAKIDALAGKRVVFDLTSGVWTIDTAAADNIGNGVVILGGNPNTDTVQFFAVHTTINYFENN